MAALNCSGVCALADVGGPGRVQLHVAGRVVPAGQNDAHEWPGAGHADDEREAGVDIREARVHQHDVRALPLDKLKRSAHVTGPTNDLHRAGHAEQVREALLDPPIRIDDHHPGPGRQNGRRAE